MTLKPLSDLRIIGRESLIVPKELHALIPVTAAASATVETGRKEYAKAIEGNDLRLVVIAGPCSIHKKEEAIEYAKRLVHLRNRFSQTMIILMRVYFEKPRTTVGWKGLINDPHLNNSFDIQEGLKLARGILLEINSLGMPCGTEFLDPIVPAYLSDLVSWCAIGARTTESQTHREMASGLSMPVGFKNSTSGDVNVAFNAMKSASNPHSFLGIDPDGKVSVLRTKGNSDTHIILRGGIDGGNCSIESHELIGKNAEYPKDKRIVMVDCSHGNAAGNFKNQLKIFDETVEFYSMQPKSILGMMLESHLMEGKQPLSSHLQYGVSITDACIGWEDTEKLLTRAHNHLAQNPAPR